MYICAFEFDINWFTTLPGMLISGGVVLLLLALLLFATSGKKNKVKKENVVATNVAPNFTDPAMNANVGMDPMMNQTFSNDPSLAMATQMEQPPIVPSNTIDPLAGNTSENVNPVNNDMTNINMEAVQPVNIEPTPVDVNPMNQEVNKEGISPIESTIIPSISPVDMVTPSVDSVTPSMTGHTVVPEIASVTPVVENNNMQMPTPSDTVQSQNNLEYQPEMNDVVIPSVDSTTTAYGGVSPAVTLQKEENSQQIYGGANPLDKTQTIPIINNSVEQNIVEEKQDPIEKTTEIPTVNTNVTPAYQEAKLVEDKDIEVLDF